jgi:hypothetical protein
MRFKAVDQQGAPDQREHTCPRFWKVVSVAQTVKGRGTNTVYRNAAGEIEEEEAAQ